MMTAPLMVQELQRLSAALWRLYRRRKNNRVSMALGDDHQTSVELNYRLGGRLVRGQIRSELGVSHFEIRIAKQTIFFRHPGVGKYGELEAPTLAPAAMELLNQDQTGTAVAQRVVCSARRLEHLSILRRVEIGIRERRDTLPSLPLAS